MIEPKTKCVIAPCCHITFAAISVATAGEEGQDLAARETIALIAHDQKKDDMAEFARRHQQALSAYDLVATGTTGGRIMDAVPGLPVTRLKSGPLGGDQQIGAMIAEGKVSMLIFFTDPLTAMPHDVDVKALTRLATVYDIPMALNRATAEMLIAPDEH
jgi:methylglyoxal synthase